MTGLPVHVGIIMDGNGRWASSRFLPRNAGHKKGAETLDSIVEHASVIGIKYLSVFAFSTENFKRPKEEVNGIFSLMRSYLKNQNKFKNNNIRLNFLGDMDALPEDIVIGIDDLEHKTKNRDGMVFNIAFNYGGRQDILQAAKKLALMYNNNKISDLSDFSENDFSKLLYTQTQPDVDLVIRTSGESRVSNFLLWQAAYAEYYFTETLWPDFSTQHFNKAIEDYSSRHRRLGGI